ncbi:MAG: hypothetical protein KIT08_07810 [Anaerolineales bacterium]|nr:MAG: hypothetical protein KIT08_07810 [Anaerolineales bacterium]
MRAEKASNQWVQASLLAAVRSNLEYWAAQPAAKLRGEGSNLHNAIRYGFYLFPTRQQAARLLSQSFGIGLTQPTAWLPLYAAALRTKPLPSSLQAGLLYQQAVLLWQHGLIKDAARAFERSQQYAQHHRLSSVHIRSLIGLCLAYSQQPAKAERAAKRLQAALSRTRTPTLRAQGYSALGTAAYFAGQHLQASQHIAAALQAAPPSLAQGQLHILAGLCAHALGQTDAALEHYNAAAHRLQQRGASPAQLARVELLRATAHYHKSTRGQHVRLQPAVAALQRAAELLNQGETDARSRAQLESLLGRAYTRRGEVAQGIRYLTSALELSADTNEPHLAADIFAALQELETKNPA